MFSDDRLLFPILLELIRFNLLGVIRKTKWLRVDREEQLTLKGSIFCQRVSYFDRQLKREKMVQYMFRFRGKTKTSARSHKVGNQSQELTFPFELYTRLIGHHCWHCCRQKGRREREKSTFRIPRQQEIMYRYSGFLTANCRLSKNTARFVACY